MTEENGCCGGHSEKKSSEGKCCQSEKSAETSEKQNTCGTEGCNNPECECQKMSTEDLANCADDKADALINLLIEKGIISEADFQKSLDDLYEQ